jgi:hypothetical protein
MKTKTRTVILKTTHGRCARCNRKVRIDSEPAMRGDPGYGLWEHEGLLYGWHCHNIVIGYWPAAGAKVEYHNPDWDNEPLPF